MAVQCPGQAAPLNQTCSVGSSRGKCPREVGITRREKLIQECVTETNNGTGTEGIIQRTISEEGKRSEEEEAPRWAIVGESVVGLLMIFLISICVIKTSKSRRRGTVNKTGTDLNPVYGDYSDVYVSTEVTDRNISNYSSQNMGGATQIMDLNSQYGQ